MFGNIFKKKIRISFGLIAFIFIGMFLFRSLSMYWEGQTGRIKLSIGSPAISIGSPAISIGSPAISIASPTIKHLIDMPYTKDRIQRLCNQNFTRYNGLKNNSYLGKSVLIDKYKFIFCMVAKTGCSFFRRVLYYLSGTKYISSPFVFSLATAHQVSLNTTKQLNEEQLKKVMREYELILFVRDPYKRLFSGYVDKVFSRYDYWRHFSSMLINKARPSASSKSKECGTDATFTDLVRYIVAQLSNGKSMDNHFMPIHYQCNPCSVKYDFIGKLEHFKMDAEYLFRKLHIEAQFIIDQAGAASIHDELVDAAHIVFGNIKNKMFKESPCLDIHNFTRRTWRKLQIKGLISNKFNFPLTKEQLVSLNETQFLSVLKKYNQDSSADPYLHKNRNLSFMEAYYSVPQNDLENLAKVFSSECKIWDYPNKPEVIFNPEKRISTGPFTYFNFDDV